MPDDRQLLHEYARDRSESAFAELTRRHINVVYSAALRETRGDAPQAQDITQAVFAELARKATELSRHPALAGWLYTCVRRMSANTRRADERRRRREQEAHAMNELPADSPESAWAQMKPVLDDAMHELSETERAAVVLRFFEERSHREVGDALGFNESAARKRVDRALEKLRALLARRGITSTASGLAAALAFGAVMSAPSGLAVTVATGATAAGASTVSTTTGILKIMAATKLKLGVISAVIVLSAATATTVVVRHYSRPAGDYFPKSSWRLAGYATPEDALETFWWAWNKADAKTMEATMTPEADKGYRDILGTNSIEADLKSVAVEFAEFKGYRIVQRRTNSPDEVVITMTLDHPKMAGFNDNADVSIKRIGNDWKVDDTPF